MPNEDEIEGKEAKEVKRSKEQRYFDALKRITQYQSVERLRKHSERDWGLSFEEALCGAYENVIYDARYAIKGHRRPK